MSPDSPRLRLSVLGVVVLSLFAALFARLWFLQVATAPTYRAAAENIRQRIVPLDAPRGRLLDRNGNVLVDNRRTIAVTVDWQAFDKLKQSRQEQVLARLANVLTRDALRQRAGEVQPGDPGPQPMPVDPEQEGEGEGEATSTSTSTSTTTTTTTTPGVTVPEGEAAPDVRITPEELRRRIDDPRFSKFRPVPVARDVSEELEVFLNEHADQFPTVSASRITVRQYRYGALAAHVLGYVGAVNADDLEAYQNPEKPYENDDEIGKAGLERTAERWLRGVPGEIRYEVDAQNRVVRELGRTEPKAGDDVYLTLDVNLQYRTERALAAQVEARRGACSSIGCYQIPGGAAVVLDPRDSQVLALASYPTYDPRLFIGGISTEEYQALASPELADQHHFPLTDRAIAGQYAPGSTWKLFSSVAGLATGQITPQTTVNDPGYYEIPGCTASDCEKQNANRQAHGVVNLQEALTVSSDVYYYKLGDEIWRRRDNPGIGNDALQRTYAQFGFGARSGIDLPGEALGRNPTPEWLREFAKDLYPNDSEKAAENGRWSSGLNMNTVIGQGDVLVTPLQLANGYAAFANGGTLHQPALVLQVIKAGTETIEVEHAFEAKAIRTVDLPPEWRVPMLEGFKGVTVSGTGAGAFSGFPQELMSVAGKTGTAQVNGKNDTSLFTAFAPADAPTLAAAVVLEEGGNGSDAAAPVVRNIFEPIALAGGQLSGLPKAPVGGGFDLEAAVQELFVPVRSGGD